MTQMAELERGMEPQAPTTRGVNNARQLGLGRNAGVGDE